MVQTTMTYSAVFTLALGFMLVASSLGAAPATPFFGLNPAEIQDCLATIKTHAEICLDEVASLVLTFQQNLVGPKCCTALAVIDEKCKIEGFSFDSFLPALWIVLQHSSLPVIHHPCPVLLDNVSRVPKNAPSPASTKNNKL